MFYLVLAIFVLCGLIWVRLGQFTSANPNRNVLRKLEVIEKSLSELRLHVRTTEEQEKLEAMFDRAKPLTAAEAELWKDGHDIGLIEKRLRSPHFCCFDYRHIQFKAYPNYAKSFADSGLDQMQFDALRRHRRRHDLDELTGEPVKEELPPNAIGRRMLSFEEQDLILEEYNKNVPPESRKIELDKGDRWQPYEFIVTNSGAFGSGASEIRCVWRF